MPMGTSRQMDDQSLLQLTAVSLENEEMRWTEMTITLFLLTNFQQWNLKIIFYPTLCRLTQQFEKWEIQRKTVHEAQLKHLADGNIVMADECHERIMWMERQ